ncbi:unnamed protein product [marine sediment metagenome]|uniref:Rubredoxin-like domain-containing protein n=1 Tax=marine sediment metagenome TaxID=412755 RepID=X0X0B7_9ZZZZ
MDDKMKCNGCGFPYAVLRMQDLVFCPLCDSMDVEHYGKKEIDEPEKP